jgi:hypothetical protein
LFKRFSSVVAAALLIAGISATPSVAAEAPFVPASSTTDSGLISTVESQNIDEVAVPAGHEYFPINQHYSLLAEFVSAHLGQKLSLAVTVIDPDGNQLNPSNGLQADVTYSSKTQGSVTGSGATYTVDAATGELTLPSTAGTYVGEIYAMISLRGSDTDYTAQIAEGTYRILVTLSANGTSVENDQYLVKDRLLSTFSLGASPAVIPQNVMNTVLVGHICLDSTKIAVGDVVRAEAWLDDTAVSTTANFSTRSSYADPSKQSFRNGSAAVQEITINKFDQTFGTAASFAVANFAVFGDTSHSYGFKLYNATTLADVSGTCAPSTPVAPVVSAVDGSLLATGALTFGAANSGTACAFYDSAAPDVVAKYVFARSGAQGTATYSCTFAEGIVGHNYVVKVTQHYLSAASEASPASASVVQPVRTLTTTPVPTISGTVKVGQTLTAVEKNWDAGVAFAYQWYASGAAIAGATGKTFTLAPGQLGKAITVKVTGSREGYTSVSKTSVASAKVAAGTITMFATPTIVGTVAAGKAVTAAPGTWMAGAKFAYVWLLDGKAIAGAKSAKLTIAKTAKGHKLSVSVTATATGYLPLTKVSKVVKVG